MKTSTCRQMGELCDMAFTGATQKEVMDQGAQYAVASANPEHTKIAEQIKTMLPEDRAKWN